jgi:hypothetical protein
VRLPLATDILVPELRISGNKLAHHFNALRQIEIDHFHAVAPHEFQTARESAAFAHDHLRDSELHNRAAAEVAGHESRIEDRVAKTSDSAGVAQTIDFRMGHRVGVLNAFVMTDREQLAIAGQRRTDWDTAFAQALSSLPDGRLHQFQFGHVASLGAAYIWRRIWQRSTGVSPVWSAGILPAGANHSAGETPALRTAETAVLPALAFPPPSR